MKRRLMALFAVFLLLGTVAADSATIKLTHSDHAGTLAIIAPDADEKGQFNVYMAAQFQGKIFFRGSTTTSWSAYVSGAFPLAQTVTLTGAPQLVRLVDFDISDLPGLSLYLGYGASQADMLNKRADHLAWIYTVPGPPDATTTGGTNTTTASTTTTTHASGGADGPGLFRQYCAQCHTIEEISGRGLAEIRASIARVPAKEALNALTDIELLALEDYTLHPDHY